MSATTSRSLRPRQLWLIGGAIVVGLVVAVVIWRSRSPESSAATPAVPAPSAIGVAGFLFQDRDGDGQRGVGEPLLAGWEVRVHSTGPAALASTTTDADGVFSFPEIANLTPGETTVEVRVQPVLEGPAVAHLPDPTALTQTFTVALGDRRAVPVAAFTPCSSAQQCPGLQMPDLIPQLTSSGGDDYPVPTETRIDTTTEPGKVLLRFATSTANLGGLLHVTAGPVSPDGNTQVVQQRAYGSGNVLVHDAGWFVFHPEHHHFHLDQFESYELLSQDRQTVLRSSNKVSFCLTDVLPVDVPERSDGHVFLDLQPFECGVAEQGINTGYADYYGADLPDQWIDVTGLVPGSYWIRLTVDPSGLLLESDETNNTAYFPVEYQAP